VHGRTLEVAENDEDGGFVGAGICGIE